MRTVQFLSDAMKAIDISGQTFGRWTVIQRVKVDHWLCRCSCGTEKVCHGSHIKSGRSRSCGCLRIESNHARGTHRMSYSSTFRIWAGMRQRCYNPTNKAFRYYGGRGIQVCARWFEFENFLEDMGLRPAGRSIDRINNDGHYMPSNCRWATTREQRLNSRHPVLASQRGKPKTYARRSAAKAGLSIHGSGQHRAIHMTRSDPYHNTYECPECSDDVPVPLPMAK